MRGPTRAFVVTALLGVAAICGLVPGSQTAVVSDASAVPLRVSGHPVVRPVVHRSRQVAKPVTHAAHATRAKASGAKASRAKAATAPTTSAASIALGVNVAGDDNPTALADYRAAAGRNPSLVMWYQSWDEPLYWPPQLGWAQHVGATPMITWDPVNGSGGIALSSIARGADDSYLRASAQLAKAYGKPLLIRFAHEMNLRGSPFGPGHEGNTPAQFVAAWRHVVSVFRSAGATNVKWVWSPNVDCGGKCPFDAFFPGDSYVDYVALDGYNYAAVDGVPWMSFDQIFAPSYRDLTRLSSKPVIIAETASVGDGDAKATWIQNAFLRSIPTAFPRVRAVVWFDRDKEANWKVNSSPASEQAWRAVVDSPIYQGRL